MTSQQQKHTVSVSPVHIDPQDSAASHSRDSFSEIIWRKAAVLRINPELHQSCPKYLLLQRCFTLKFQKCFVDYESSYKTPEYLVTFSHSGLWPSWRLWALRRRTERCSSSDPTSEPPESRTAPPSGLWSGPEEVHNPLIEGSNIWNVSVTIRWQ